MLFRIYQYPFYMSSLLNYIKKVLKIVKGSDHEYNYNSADRGFYATNFCLRWDGYMVNGKGTCGVFKNPSGLWSARYYKNNKNKGNSKSDNIDVLLIPFYFLFN